MHPRLRLSAFAAPVVLAIVAAFLVAGMATAHAEAAGTPAPNQAAGLDYQFTFTHDGLARSYRVFVPTKPASNPGLMVFLHGRGFGGGAAMEEQTQLDITAGQQGHYVVYPDGIEDSWNASKACCAPANERNIDDVGFIDEVIDRVKLTYAIDPGKIAVGGASNGGYLANRYACEGAQTFQALLPMITTTGSAHCTTTPRPYRVLAINGMKDLVFPWTSPEPAWSSQGNMDRFELANGCGPGWTSTKDAANGNLHYVAKNCRAGASIDQYAVPWLDHRWTATPDSWSTYGINMTKVSWDWLVKVWNATPPSPLTQPGPLPADVPPAPVPTDPTTPAPLPTPTAPAAPLPVATAIGAAPNQAAGQDFAVTATSGGTTVSYRLFVPNKKIKAAGLLVFMSEQGTTGAQSEAMTDLDTTAGSRGHFVAYPDPAPAGVSPLDSDVRTMDAIIASTKLLYPAITSKVAVAGFSIGGTSAYRYACLGAEPVQAVVGVAAVASAVGCEHADPTHVLGINGLKDSVVPWTTVTKLTGFLTPPPPAKTAMDTFEQVVGCGPGWTSTTDPTNGNIAQVARSCVAGASVDQTVVPWMTHRWTSKSSDWSTSGMNATVATWNFVNKYWA